MTVSGQVDTKACPNDASICQAESGRIWDLMRSRLHNKNNLDVGLHGQYWATQSVTFDTSIRYSSRNNGSTHGYSYWATDECRKDLGSK